MIAMVPFDGTGLETVNATRTVASDPAVFGEAVTPSVVREPALMLWLPTTDVEVPTTDVPSAWRSWMALLA
ncbi:MAG TPA: hypothetical protein DCP73_15505 [Chloroflexi bacterium]|nr:hypothetical protein [Chloroflexota bacterium]